MNERIEQLRQNSLNAENCISAERALLVTQFYQSPEARGISIPMQRAGCFDYIMSSKEICILPDELIVGERGPAPKAAPTYPEICVHTEDDLRILHAREKVSFRVDEEVFRAYREIIIPFWKGKSNRDRIYSTMAPEWLAAYDAGIFTEFQEQRASGHTVAGNKIYHKGMLKLIEECDAAIEKLDYVNDERAYDKREQLEAMKTAAAALIKWARRHAEKLDELSKNESRPERREELKKMASICRKVPAQAPETFHEALQHYWFIHVGVITELNPWDSFNPGRLDQHLYPFYKKELEAGTLTVEQAKELLQAFWIKFNNHPAPPKVGVTAKESNTYTDFALINLGGVKPDGSDAVNDLSYVILDVVEEMRLLQPSSMIQVSKKNPDRFVNRAMKIVKTGFGQPSIFNTDALVQELVYQGKSFEDARNGGASGCVEVGAFGKEAYFLTGYFNLPKILELTLNNGVDPRTGIQLGLKTGDVSAFESYEDLLRAYEKQLDYFIDIKIRGNNIIERIFAAHTPVPFLSLIIDDCIDNGTDYIAGGARYNNSYIQGVGLATLADSLTALKYHVFEKHNYTLQEFTRALSRNFEGYDSVRLALIYDTPKYGNDDDYADARLPEIFESFYAAVVGKKNTRGGCHRIIFLPTTCHVYFGSVTGASPDGRLAGKPLSEGISPVQGADVKGPAAVIKSAGKIDHVRTGGTLLNQKFSPQFFENDEAISKVTSLIRSYFRMDGHHIQFNVVSADLLRKAQKHPEDYKDLIVRVAGYSDYFKDLGEDLQEEIILRTEQSGV
ncbi:MAG: glycyl radical protein [Sedimentisphaerales bacterium]|nr:glycyl radical protein [Sedimentisphaerales bacterium]